MDIISMMLASRVAGTRGSSGGVSSWNDLTDKPFGDEVTEIYGDTVTWDGNVDGHDAVGNDIFTYCRVSDAVPTMEDFAKGGQIVFKNPDGAEEVLGFDDLNDYGLGWIQSGYFVVIQQDNITTLGYTWKKTGVYFMKADDGGIAHTASLTINGYTGFKTVNKTVKTIDPKYLPEGGFGYSKMVEIVPETKYTLEDQGGGMMGAMIAEEFPMVAGETYDVVWNGVSYKCEALECDGPNGQTMVAIGDVAAMGLPYSSSGDPFVIATTRGHNTSMIVALDGSASVVVTIRYEEIRKLDTKYLPDSAYYVTLDGNEDDGYTLVNPLEEVQSAFYSGVTMMIATNRGIFPLIHGVYGRHFMATFGGFDLFSGSTPKLRLYQINASEVTHTVINMG